MTSELVYGRRPVREAVRGPREVRELWATHPAVVSTEILTTPVTAALLIARRAL